MKAPVLAGLAAVMVLAGALRFAALDRQGLLFFDEGQLILEARETGALARAWGAAAAGRPGAREEFAAAISRSRIEFAKPAHNALLAALLATIPRADQATLALSATAGTLTVLLVWWLARGLYGEAVGLLAACLLAVSPYHLLYSREGLSDALTVAGWTGALALFLRPGNGAALGAGLLGGLTVATNYRTLFLPALFAILAWQGTPAPRARAAAERLGWWMAGFVVPLLAVEGAYRIAIAAGGGARFPAGTYTGQLAELLSFHGSQGFRFSGWLAFGDHLWRWEGAASLAIFLCVLPWQLSRWRGPDGFVNAALLCPWLIFSAYWDNASRFFTIMLPLVAVVKARWLWVFGSWTARRIPPLPRLVVPLAAVACLVPFALRLVPRPTPYLAAAEFLARSGDPRHLSTNSRLGLAYFGPGASVQMPADDAEVRQLREAGLRWAVTDIQALFGGFDHPEERIATAERIAGRCPSVLFVPYGQAALAQFVLEQDLAFNDARALLASFSARGPRLHVFDLTRRR